MVWRNWLYVFLLMISLTLPVPVMAGEMVTYSEGFEDNNGGYTADGNARWEWLSPASPGPTSANSGSKCWGSIPTTAVVGAVEGNLYSPTITVPNLNSGQVARLRFFAYLNINYEQYGEGDLYVSADGKQTWQLRGRFYEKMAGGWQRYVFDLSPYAGKNINLRFRAYMQNVDPGFYIDDVALMIEDGAAPATSLALEASEDTASNASCPWVYTWDGTTFVRDNDIYPVARQLTGKMRDHYLLQRPLVAQDGRYNLEIREVEAEDSWTDHVALRAVDHHANVAVAPDDKGAIIAYRPDMLATAVSAISGAGSAHLAEVTRKDGSGFKAYSGDYLDLSFDRADLSQEARLLLRVKGFIQGEGTPKPFTAPPAIIVQLWQKDAWQEVGRMTPRFQWADGGVDLSPFITGGERSLKIRLVAISHGSKYHEIDFVGLATGPEPKVTVTDLPLETATFGVNDVRHLLLSADSQYVEMASGNHFSLSFAKLDQKPGTVRDFILVSEGYYVPRSSTYFVYTWDGSQWIMRGSHSFDTSDSVYSFDLSSVLPDPAGEYKARIWQDYSNFPAAIDAVTLVRDKVPGTLTVATDLRNGNSVLQQVQASDNLRLEYPLDSVTKQPRNRWTEYRWTGFAANVPPSIPAGQLTVQGYAISWTYFDTEGSPQAAADIQVWSGAGGTGKCFWSPPTVSGAATGMVYGGPNLTEGATYYVRVRVNDGSAWGAWREAAFRAPSANPTVAISAPAAGASYIAPATVSIVASPTPGRGATVDRVEFYANSILVGTATTSPYAITWNVTIPGNYALTAKVLDSLGGTATSSPVGINVTGTTLPEPWLSQDVGIVGLTGNAGFLNGTFVLSGAGADIWGRADAFRFVSTPVAGDCQIVARISSVQNTNSWAKAGVMIRESLNANAPNALMAITAASGSAFQRRLIAGDISYSTAGARVAAPYWVKLVRSGNLFSGYISADGVTWVAVGSETIAMAGPVYIGLAVTSHNTAALSTAIIDSVALTGQPPVILPSVNLTSPVSGVAYAAPATIKFAATASAGSGATVTRVDFCAGENIIATVLGNVTTNPYSFSWENVPAGSYSLTASVTDSLERKATSAPVAVTVTSPGLPQPWDSNDIGTVSAAGSSGYLDGIYSLKVMGGDIWGRADSFRYVYQPLTGDGEIVARIVSLDNTDSWAKAGVMIRQNLAANSPNAFMAITAGSGLAFQRRLIAGDISYTTAGARLKAPYWLKLIRSGSTISGYASADGTTWTLVGSDTVAMAGTVYIGLAVSSHNTAAFNTATFDKVQFTMPSPWLSQDIGTGLSGSTVYLNGTYTVSGSGADIWGYRDAFRYVYKPLTGDGELVARVVNIQNTNSWAKAGVMIRESLEANAANAFVAVTPSKGIVFQRRLSTGALTVNTNGPRVAAPQWLKITRSGDTITGYLSADGVNWALVGSDTIAMGSSIYIGLAVTSHDATVLNTATIDNVK